MSDQPTVYQAYQGNTYLFGGNAPYVEEMYENYLPTLAAFPILGVNTSTHCSTFLPLMAPTPKTFPTSPSSMLSPSAPSKVAPRWLWIPVRTPNWVASALLFSN